MPSSEPMPAPRTAYVVKVYPRFSETFIVTELLAREAAGESLEIFALRPTTDTRFHPEIARVQAPVTFLPKPTRLAEGWALLAEATATIPGFAQRYARLLPELTDYDAADVHQAVDLACRAVARGITHLHAHFASLAGRTAELAALLAGIGYSVTTHAKDIFHSSVRDDRLGRTIARSRHTVAISRYNLDHLRTRFPEHAGKIHLVHNGLELARFPYREPARFTGDRPLRVAAVGRMVEKKGFFDLVRAVAALTGRGVALRVRIAGEGELFERVRAAVAIAGLEDVITLLGARTQQEVRELLEWADVFAAPSVVGADGNVDGLPTVLLEAMASGVPCVASTVTGIPEAVEDGVNGFLHEPGDVAGLEAALCRAADPGLDRRALARAARRRIEERFDSRDQARRLAALERSTSGAPDTGTRDQEAPDGAAPATRAPRAEAPAVPDATTTQRPCAAAIPADLAGARVAYVCADPGIPVFGTKGASVHVQEVVRELLRRGALVTIFAARTGEHRPADLAEARVVHLPVTPREPAAREAAQGEVSRRFALEIVAGGFDLVYERYSLFSTALAQVAPAGVPGVLEVNAPLIDEQRTHRVLVAEATAHEVLRRQVRAAVRVVAVSEPVAGWVAGHCDGAPVLVVPNGVNTQRIRPGTGSADGQRPVVAFVGTLKPWHGVETLLRARELARTDWELRIIGDGPEGEQLRGLARAAGLGDRVTFTGAVTPEQVPQLLRDCDLAAAPYPAAAARDDYFSPLKVYEYLAAGLPVVASRTGQLPRVLADTDAGILVPPSDPGALARALDELVAAPARRRRMAGAARALAETRHSWTGVVDRILAGPATAPDAGCAGDAADAVTNAVPTGAGHGAAPTGPRPADGGPR